MNVGYIISLDGGKYYPMFEHIFYDLKNCSNIRFVLDKPKRYSITNLLLKNKVRRITKGKLDFICYNEGSLFQACEEMTALYDRIIVLFLNSTFIYKPYVASTLKKYKEKNPKLVFALLYIDIMNSGVSANANYLRENGVFDAVYTIDRGDSERSEIPLWNTLYSKVNSYEKLNKSNDIYFCGASKQRWKIFANLVDAAKKNSVEMGLDIVPTEASQLLKKEDNVNIFSQGQYLSYEEVLRRELQATCILEIVQEGQTALTLRPYEAVVYNKKLLTNNRTITDFRYYDPRYMRYFKEIDDIDWAWVKENVDVDYKYIGDFSPRLFLEELRKKLINMD